MEHPERTLRVPLRVRVRPAPLVREDRALHRHRERLVTPEHAADVARGVAPMNLAEIVAVMWVGWQVWLGLRTWWRR
jgi:hypothetical protein